MNGSKARSLDGPLMVEPVERVQNAQIVPAARPQVPTEPEYWVVQKCYDCRVELKACKLLKKFQMQGHKAYTTR